TALRFASTASALIEKNDAIKGGIEETPLVGIASAAGAAMEKYNRLPVGVAALLVINLVTVGNIQPVAVERLDFRIQIQLGIIHGYSVLKRFGVRVIIALQAVKQLY